MAHGAPFRELLVCFPARRQGQSLHMASICCQRRVMAVPCVSRDRSHTRREQAPKTRTRSRGFRSGRLMAPPSRYWEQARKERLNLPFNSRNVKMLPDTPGLRQRIGNQGCRATKEVRRRRRKCGPWVSPLVGWCAAESRDTPREPAGLRSAFFAVHQRPRRRCWLERRTRAERDMHGT